MKRHLIIRDQKVQETSGKNAILGSCLALAPRRHCSSNKRQKFSPVLEEEIKKDDKQSRLLALLTSAVTVFSNDQEGTRIKQEEEGESSQDQAEHREEPEHSTSASTITSSDIESRRNSRSVSLCEEDVRCEDVYRSYVMDFPESSALKAIKVDFRNKGISSPPRLASANQFPMVAPLAIANSRNNGVFLTSRTYGKQTKKENIREYSIQTNSPLSPTRIRIQSIIYE